MRITVRLRVPNGVVPPRGRCHEHRLTQLFRGECFEKPTDGPDAIISENEGQLSDVREDGEDNPVDLSGVKPSNHSPTCRIKPCAESPVLDRQPHMVCEHGVRSVELLPLPVNANAGEKPGCALT